MPKLCSSFAFGSASVPQLRIQGLISVLGPEVAYLGLSRSPGIMMVTGTQQVAATHAALQVISESVLIELKAQWCALLLE